MEKMKEMLGGCCVCLGDDGWDDDPLVFCDGQNCNVAVHRYCYGIITVPSGPWFCRKCESPKMEATVRCELCPSQTGAFKRTDNDRWAHVVCALYIPEIKFGDDFAMEPIILNLTPQERFYKSCCICESQGKECNAKIGACMNCKKPGCKNQFHVTCAQALGFLCVEAEKLSSSVKYCGYCPHHFSQLKKGAKLKTIPTFKLPSSASDLALVKSDSSSTGCLENPARSGTTEIRNEERKRKKHNSCKPSSSTGNRDSTTALPGVESTQKEATAETDADQNSSSLAVNQEAHKLKTENSKSSGSRKKVKLPRVVPRVLSPNKKLSALQPSTPIAPKTELTRSPKDAVKSVAPTNLCISIKTECTVTELAVDAGAAGPSTSGIVTTSEVEQVAASTMADCSGQNELSSSSPMSTKVTEKELHIELDAAPPPKIKKPRRSLLPKAPPTGKRSSKRRKKEDKSTPSIVDAVYLGGLLHQPSSYPVKPESKPETETHSLILAAPQLNLQSGGFTVIKAPTAMMDPIYAPQMLGNELNPDSSTSKEMSESLSAEVDMHNVFTVPSPTSTSFVNVPLPRRNVSSVVDKTMAALGSSPAPQGLAELLERQWEQGSQLLMEQAQPYDIASLLSSLHIIRQENSQLEDHVAGLIQRRDRLLAVNARLSVPLTVQPSTQAASTEGSLNGHLKEITIQERSSHITSYQPLLYTGISTAEQQIEADSRVNNIDHPLHPTGGLPSTMSPIQGSTGFSSFTPEMTMGSSTSTTECQLPGLHPHSFHPVSVPTVPG